MIFSGTATGWRSKRVSARAGDRIRLVASTTTARFGYLVLTSLKYVHLTKTATFSKGKPATLEFTAPTSSDYLVGVTVTGDFVVDIEIVSPTLGYWPEPGPMGANSFWRTPIDEAPLDVKSAEFVADVVRQAKMSAGSMAFFNVWQYNIPRYKVSPATPRVNVRFRDDQHKGYEPRSIRDPKYGAHFVGVPITAEMVAAVGTDAAISMWCEETNQLWGLWRARQDPDGTWSAVWGGRIDNVSQSRGFYPDGMGISATGVATEVGVIGIEEAQAGEITHALSLTLIDCAPWWDFVWPAQRSDGNGKSPVPEGTRFRLDPTINVDSLKLTPIAKMAARAAQKYGFIVADKSYSSITISAEAGSALTPNPWGALMGGEKSFGVFRNFPWDKLQAIERGWGKKRYIDRVSSDVESIVGDSA